MLAVPYQGKNPRAETISKKVRLMGNFKYTEILTRELLTRPDIVRLSNAEIGRSLCISPSVVEDYRRLYGLISDLACSHRVASDIRDKERLRDWEIGVLAGTLLGDGNLTLNKQGHARFRVRHCDRQREYVDVLHHLFFRFCTNDVTVSYVEETGYAYHGFSTIWHPDFTRLYNMMYRDGKKIVTQEVLDLLTVPGLVCWFYDDGSKLSGKTYSLSTCGFTLEENKLIRQHLFRRFGIKTSIMRKSNGVKRYYYLYFARGTVHILERYISDLYLPCFGYKLYPTVLRSSEITRGTLWDFMLQSEDIVRPSQRCEEAGGNIQPTA